jgi:hypothetical protein
VIERFHKWQGAGLFWDWSNLLTAGACEWYFKNDEKAVRLAVTAHIRHQETRYDELLLDGLDRSEARQEMRAQVGRVTEKWQSAK